MYIKKDIENLYKSLEEKIEKKSNKKLLHLAFVFAYKKHKNQKNIDGKLIVTHILNTALIASSITKENKVIIACLLHHCLDLGTEETKYIEDKFGGDVLKILKGFKALSDIEYKKGELSNNPNLFNYYLKLSGNDIRVFLIKICSRLDFIKDFNNLDKSLKEKISIETLEIYIPLIKLFGLNRYIKDIEDICFKNINPSEYREVEKIILEKKDFLENKLENIKETIQEIAIEKDLEIKIEGRIKSIYSLAKKMKTKKIPISGIYDLLAVRIITNSKKDAYIFLGLVHSIFKSKENRIKDYISAPKPNGYQSIHTTVVDNDGYVFEIQIQTKQMYEFNIFGIASHNLYKGAIKNPKSYPEWMRRITAENKKAFSKNRLSDLFQDIATANENIFCITPTFEKIELPKDSTILDFAFKIHTSFGNRVKGAWVNGEYIKDLVYILKNKDRIKLDLSKKEKEFKIEYIAKVKTKIAKKNIIASFKNKSEEKIIELGEFLLNERIELLDYKRFSKMPKILQKNILQKNNLENLNSLYYEIGIGHLPVDKIIKQINNIEEQDGKYKTIVKLAITFKVNDYKNINGLFGVFHNHNISIINIDYRGIYTTVELNIKNTELLNDLIVEISRLPNIYKVKRIFSSKMKRFITIFTLFSIWTIIHPIVLIFLNNIFDIPEYYYKWFFYLNIAFFISMIYLLKNIVSSSLPGLLQKNFFWKLMFLLNTFTLITVGFEALHIFKETNIIFLISIVILLYGLTGFEYLDSKFKNKK